jgi:hypothetical protein
VENGKETGFFSFHLLQLSLYILRYRGKKEKVLEWWWRWCGKRGAEGSFLLLLSLYILRSRGHKKGRLRKELKGGRVSRWFFSSPLQLHSV